ncbi:MAG: hypothetical protein Q9169_002103 [Polycauliona sp. 2 TL-2023]
MVSNNRLFMHGPPHPTDRSGELRRGSAPNEGKKDIMRVEPGLDLPPLDPPRAS